MPPPLRVLLIEDSEDDATLILRALRRGGYDPVWERHDTAAGVCTALSQMWDIILCDYVMPQFSAAAALRLVQERGLDVPVIVVSGEGCNEAAVAALKGGARDYVMKDGLDRLVPAVARALGESPRPVA